MSDLRFDIAAWLEGVDGESLERETLASLRISAEDVDGNAVTITDVEDTIAQTVRDHIVVAAYPLARWLVLNWWRLRWEPAPLAPRPSSAWLETHSLASIGDGFAWPALIFASDGEIVQLRHRAEARPDVSAVRYLREVSLNIPAATFERAVDVFVEAVDERVRHRAPGERELSELRDELDEERNDPAQALACKLQALAGIDPGAADDAWLRAVEKLKSLAGVGATEEILAAAHTLPGGLTEADATLGAMRASRATIELAWATDPHGSCTADVPWQRGARMAQELRKKVNLPPGAIKNDVLGDLLGARLPLDAEWAGSTSLRGGYRDETGTRTRVLVTSPHRDSQRFYLARLIAAAARVSDEEHVLAVSDAATAFQKYERSFAQEFLCPWAALDALTDEKGTGDDGIAEAAAHFEVSELLVLSTLVNHGKVPRSRLQRS